MCQNDSEWVETHFKHVFEKCNKDQSFDPPSVTNVTLFFVKASLTHFIFLQVVHIYQTSNIPTASEQSKDIAVLHILHAQQQVSRWGTPQQQVQLFPLEMPV